MVLVSRGSVPWLPDGIIGRCDECGELVPSREWDHAAEPRHPCFPCGISYSLKVIVNPDNTPWLPGYTFSIRQASGTRTGHRSRGHTHMTSRTYWVDFQIGYDGVLRHIGGPKPPDHVMAAFEEKYARERPGSNWFPGADDE